MSPGLFAFTAKKQAMAENPEPAVVQASPEAPAASAPASVSDVTAWAKSEGAKLEAELAAESPAPTTPDSKEPPAAADAGTSEPKADEPEAEKLSRRQRDEQRRAEIRAEVEAEIATRTARETHAAEQARQQRESEESLLNTIAKAKAGDYNAALALANVTEAQLVTMPKQTQREMQVYNAGREAVLADMAKDFEPTLRAIPGIEDAEIEAIRKAPTSGQFAKANYDLGVKHSDAKWESKVATLEAELTAIKGRYAASGPSPLHANGTNGRGTLPAGSGMRSIAEQVFAEAGVPFQ